MTIHIDETSIKIDESSYSATQSAVIVIWSDKSKTELERHCWKNRFVRTHGGDRPGQVYAYSLNVLRYLKGDNNYWQAVCISSSHWDI